MSVPNIGPEPIDPGDPAHADTPRRGNPALIYRDDAAPDGMAAATTRATTVSARFGGVRYALTRRDDPPPPATDPGSAANR
ncbi:hypothetical protein [Actinoplanes sp. NPDC051859]|uniref:hypothetical protein n=1 Tax=Actinoplanes sp. NPDC051859 TaxID=3363909 RepID=UPI0037B34921